MKKRTQRMLAIALVLCMLVPSALVRADGAQPEVVPEPVVVEPVSQPAKVTPEAPKAEVVAEPVPEAEAEVDAVSEAEAVPEALPELEVESEPELEPEVTALGDVVLESVHAPEESTTEVIALQKAPMEKTYISLLLSPISPESKYLGVEIPKGGVVVDVTFPDGTALKYTASERLWFPAIPSGVNLQLGDKVSFTVTEEGKLSSTPQVVEVQKNIYPISDPDSWVPEGFQRVTFETAGKGRLDGETAFDVRNRTLSGELTYPTPIADTGHRFIAWNVPPAEGFIILDAFYSFQAEFEEIDEASAPFVYPVGPQNTVIHIKHDNYKEVSVVFPNGEKVTKPMEVEYATVIVPVPEDVTLAIGDELIVTGVQTEGNVTAPATVKVEETLIVATDRTAPTPTGYVRFELRSSMNIVDYVQHVLFLKPESVIGNTPLPDPVVIDTGYVFRGWSGEFDRKAQISHDGFIHGFFDKVGSPGVPTVEFVSQTVNIFETPDVMKHIKNPEVLPEGTLVFYSRLPQVKIPGEQTLEIMVQLPDGYNIVEDVPLTVVDNRTEAERNAIQGREHLDVQQGELYSFEAYLRHVYEKLKDTKIEDVTEKGAIDIDVPGEYVGRVKITYPDDSFQFLDIELVVRPWSQSIEDKDEKTGVLTRRSPDAFNREIFLRVFRTTEEHRSLHKKRAMEAYDIYWTNFPEYYKGEQHILPKVRVFVTIPLGENTTKDLRLEHLNADGSLTAYPFTLDKKAKTVSFYTADFSTYVLSSTPAKKAPAKSTKTDNPKTGDVGVLMPIFSVALAASGAYLIEKRRREEE